MAELVMGSMSGIVRMSLQMKPASETARRNKEDCLEILKIANRASAILQRMVEAEMLDNEVMREPVDNLAKSIEHALELVRSCQDTSIATRLFGARKISKHLQRAKEDIAQKMMAVSNACSFHITVQLAHLAAPTLPPPSRASQPQDAALDSDNHHSSNDNRSEIDGEGNNVPAAGCISPVASLPAFELPDLEAATLNFSEGHIIGSGPCSFVYKGELGGQEIAIKSHRRFAEFSEKQAVDGLNHVSAKLKHPNILGVLGYALGHPKGEQDRLKENKKHCYGFLIIEEKMHGSLHQIIRGYPHDGYNWNSRFEIIKGIAGGLSYLHKKNAVHSNLKPSNILIDTDDPKKSKICDFGVDRVLDNGELPKNASYLAPEYLKNTTTKTDVYAFGLILLQTIRSMCEAVPDDDDPKKAITWASEVHHAQRMNPFGRRPRRIDGLLNSRVTNKAELKEIKRCMKIGLQCCKEKPEDRPTMKEVVDEMLG